jgi:hypothetical protein
MICRAKLAALLLIPGCAYRVPVPQEAERVPSVAADDLMAATVTVSDGTQSLASADVLDIAAHTRELLASAVEEAAAGSSSARVTVVIAIDESHSYAESALSQDGIAIFGLLPALFGMVIEEATISADVTFEKGGLVYHGHETAALEGSLFARARRRALAAALDRALASATVSLAD